MNRRIEFLLEQNGLDLARLAHSHVEVVELDELGAYEVGLDRVDERLQPIGELFALLVAVGLLTLGNQRAWHTRQQAHAVHAHCRMCAHLVEGNLRLFSLYHTTGQNQIIIHKKKK